MTDDDPMPFGRYGPKPKGEGRLMRNVPASYLHYLWTHGLDPQSDVAGYIRENLAALQQEYPDGIWS